MENRGRCAVNPITRKLITVGGPTWNALKRKGIKCCAIRNVKGCKGEISAVRSGSKGKRRYPMRSRTRKTVLVHKRDGTTYRRSAPRK